MLFRSRNSFRCAIVLVPVGLSACGTDETVPQPEAEIRVGATAAYSGGQSFLGKATDETLNVARAQINALGGVLGRQLALDIRDDGSLVDQAEKAIDDLLAVPPLAGFVGPSTSDQALAVHERFLERKLVMFAPLATSSALTDAQPTG